MASGIPAVLTACRHDQLASLSPSIWLAAYCHTTNQRRRALPLPCVHTCVALQGGESQALARMEDYLKDAK